MWKAAGNTAGAVQAVSSAVGSVNTIQRSSWRAVPGRQVTDRQFIQGTEMEVYISMKFAQENNRTIPTADKVFALSGRAKAAAKKYGDENVVNASLGALMDDNGKLAVLSSVIDAIRKLEPTDYAEYAPIGGTPEFKEAVKKALFGKYTPEGYVSMCATPGGTGSISNVIMNYSQPGDQILTHDWCWANYKNICSQHGRSLATFQFFDEEGNFNGADLAAKIQEIGSKQDSLVVMINTPAHNPTGYSLSLEDWDAVIEAVNAAPCKVALFMDIAYIDYAGDEDEVRAFLPKLAGVNDNVLPIFGYSASKTLTAYGMRCGAIVCLAKDEETAEEFRRVTEYAARATWSNCNRSAQVVMGKIYSDPELLAKVDAERTVFRDMLLERGRAFEEALNAKGCKCVPFRAGFFVTVACDDPAAICAELEKQNIFCLALARGIRISIAGISKEKCIRTANALGDLLNK